MLKSRVEEAQFSPSGRIILIYQMLLLLSTIPPVVLKYTFLEVNAF